MSGIKRLAVICAVTVVAVATPGCNDPAAPSRLQVRVSGDPADVLAGPIQPVNAVVCRYTIRARSYGGYTTDVELLGMRSVLRGPAGTDSTRLSAQELNRLPWFAATPFERATEWGWGGPVSFLPITIENTLYFQRRDDPRRDSASFSVVCHQ